MDNQLQFRVETVYTLESMKALIIASRNDNSGFSVLRRVMRVFALIAGYFLLAAFVLFLHQIMRDTITKETDIGLRYLSSTFPDSLPTLAFALVLILPNSYSFLARIRWLQYAHKGQKFTYDFNDYNFVTVDVNTTSDQRYAVISHLYRRPGYYILMVDRNHGHVLNTADFTVGDPDEFGAFIEARTGLTVRNL